MAAALIDHANTFSSLAEGSLDGADETTSAADPTPQDYQTFRKLLGDSAPGETLHRFVENLPTCCILKDEALRYVIVNKRFCALLDKRPEDLLGFTARDLYPDSIADVYEARELRVMATGEEEEFSETLLVGGAEVHANTKVALLTDAAGRKYTCITLFDTTELVNARKAAESADRLKTDFLQTVSHELRTPLNGVLGLAEVLKLENLTPGQSQIVDVIQASGQTLISLVTNILDMTSIEADRLNLSVSAYSVEEVVENVAKLMTPIADKAGLTLVLSSGPNPPRRGVGDVSRIHQVLSNFVNNAIKFTDEGGVEMRIDGSAENNELIITVIDTGIGLSQEEQRRLFERFERSDRNRHRPRQGLGLGLSICRSLAEMMGGRVFVKSDLGVGSTFGLILPLVADGHQSPVPEAMPPVAPVEVRDAHPIRRRGWIGRLLSMKYPVVEADDDGLRVRIVAFEIEDLGDERLDDLRAHLRGLAPVIAALPQSCSEAAHRLTDHKAGVDCIVRPASSRELRAKIASLAGQFGMIDRRAR